MLRPSNSKSATSKDLSGKIGFLRWTKGPLSFLGSPLSFLDNPMLYPEQAWWRYYDVPELVYPLGKICEPCYRTSQSRCFHPTTRKTKNLRVSGTPQYRSLKEKLNMIS